GSASRSRCPGHLAPPRRAAYESLLKSKRKQIHSILVAALEDSKSAAPELLAYHADRAEQYDKAIDYWEQAGNAAIARPAYREAIGHLGSAIQLTRKMGATREWQERELKLQIALGQAMIATYGYGAQPTVDTFQRALGLVEVLGDTPLRMPALFGEWVATYVRGADFSIHVQRFARLADESGDQALLTVSHRLLGLDCLHKGKFADSLALIEKSLELYGTKKPASLLRDFGHDQRVAALNYKCWALWHLGYPEQARLVGEESASWAEELNHANTIGLARCWGINLANVLQRDTATVAREAEKLIRFSEEMAMPLWVAWSRVFLGWSEVIGNGDTAGLSSIEAGLEQARNIGAALLMPLLQCLAAESYAQAGQREAAEKAINAAYAAMDSSGDVAWRVQLHIVSAKIALMARPQQIARAEEQYLQGINTAREQKAKMLELRAATGLAKLWAEGDRVEEAQRMVAALYDEFTEGHDSVDLQAAHLFLKAPVTAQS
ncbi:MAG: hypothetical protein AAF420_08630, partial [Pseudomonadota bacterium]